MSTTSEDNHLRVVKFVQELLLDTEDELTISAEAISRQIDLVLTMKPSWGNGLDREKITDELIRRFSVWIGKDTTLKNEEDHVHWLNTSRKTNWRYWPRYREWMEAKLSWKAVDALDRSTDTILGLIEDPLREDSWDRRGLDDAVKHSKNVTLAVSRDGVSLGIAPFGNFEMASVATLSVYCDGERLGTIYLACAPEDNQETLSRNFTSLLTSIIRSRGSKLSRIVYVSDAGKIETAYWKNVLRHLYVDGQRIRIQRIVDYYHASLRLTTIADALRLATSQRTEWLKRVRKLLLEPGGWGRVMRSIAGMQKQHGIKSVSRRRCHNPERLSGLLFE